MRALQPLACAAAMVCLANVVAAGDLKVETNFPGGNVIVDKIDGETLFVRPDLRDTPRDWFYWRFRVRDAADRTIHVHFAGSDPIGPRGPAHSLDGGKTWKFLGRDAVQAQTFAYRAPAGVDVIEFAFAIPYDVEQWNHFTAARRSNGHFETETLCRTPQGRPVEMARFGKLGGGAAHRVLVVARHHACESMANYVLEGLIDAVLAADDTGRRLSTQVEFAAVPFMDRDGVERGDQGKMRSPHDHWEDYADESRYAEVRAVKEFTAGWTKGPTGIALDLHCPARLDHTIYFATPSTPIAAAGIGRIAAALEADRFRPLAFRAADAMPFERGWNTASYYGRRKCFMQWMSELPGVIAAGTLEMPYADVAGTEVTSERCREFGRALARAIEQALR